MHGGKAAMSYIRSGRVWTRPTGSRCQRSAPAYVRSESAPALGAYRVIYIATLADAIHVLHAFQKKSQKTAQRDLDLADARLRQSKRGLER
jgi:phage-related protein